MKKFFFFMGANMEVYPDEPLQTLLSSPVDLLVLEQ